MTIQLLFILQNGMDKAKFIFKVGHFSDVAEGQVITIQIMRTGKRNHQIYGKFEVTEETLQDVVNNFYENKRGVDIAIDENHEPNHAALGRIREIKREEPTALYAKVELTKRGAEVVSQGLYKYFSPEIARKWVDEESGETIKNLLIGGAFTNRPFFKNMSGLMASEVAEDDKGDNYLLSSYSSISMEKAKQLLEKLGKETKVTAAQFSELQEAVNELTDAEKAEVKTEVDAVEAKVESDKGSEGKEGGEGSDKGAGEDKTVVTQHSESVTITQAQFAEFKKLEATVSDLAKREKERNLTDKFQSMCFSEKNNEAVLLPKHKDAVVAFAAGLSDEQANKFFEIIGQLKSNTAEMFSELGSDSGNGEFSEKDMMKQVDEMAEKLMKDKKMDAAEAYKQAMKACNTKKM